MRVTINGLCQSRKGKAAGVGYVESYVLMYFCLLIRKRFFLPLVVRMTKLSFVIGEFISGWSHEAWMKIMPCGSL